MQLTPDLLLRAYAIGIFPMAESRVDPELHWIDPDMRGILPLDRFHLPRKLRARIRRGDFEQLYNELFDMGFAHSVECWQDGILVGGLYGVSLGAAFFGESMFSRVTDASKVALAHLVLRLRRGGFQLLDTQFTTPHLSRFGVLEIPREDYRRLLTKAVSGQAQFYSGAVPEAELEAFLQSTTQTS